MVSVLMVKVCHITTVHGLKDDRIFYKECVSLVKAGYDVSLVVTHDKEEIINGVKIVPLKKSKGRVHRIFIKSFSAFRKALKTKSKIYHFHDPELIFIGILLKVWGKKVIFDSHENVSKQIQSKNWIGNKVIRKIVSSLYRGIEIFGIWTFNSVISVTPEIVEFLSRKKGNLIRNFPILELINKVAYQEKNQITTLIYAGGLSKIRGIEELCKAVSLIENKNIKLQLLGNWESENYKNDCINHAPERIEYLGLFPMENVYKFMKQSHIGIATLYPEKNYLNSLPIKAFEYMACGLPIIMSDFPYWKKNFNECAIFVDPYDHKSIKEAIVELLDDTKKMKNMSANGFDIVYQQYSWESEQEKLIELYKKLS